MTHKFDQQSSDTRTDGSTVESNTNELIQAFDTAFKSDSTYGTSWTFAQAQNFRMGTNTDESVSPLNSTSHQESAMLLLGGTGNDVYVFGRGYGADTITDADSTSGNTDQARFLAGVAANQLWFRHVGSNLEVSIIGTSDKLTVQNWYSGAANQVEQFKTADNKTLLNSQVENLVSAMAAFAPPASGQTTLPANDQTSLNPVIAANWK